MAQNFAERLGWIPKSEDLRMSMGRALNFAQERKHTEVTLEHFLLALIDDPNASAVFSASGVETERLRDQIEVYINEELQHLAALGDGMAQPSESFKKVMAHASAAAEQSQRDVVDGAIVLAALIGEGQSEAAHILNDFGMTFDVVVNSLKNSNAAQAQPRPRPAPQPQQAPVQQEQQAYHDEPEELEEPEETQESYQESYSDSPERPEPAMADAARREVHPGPMGLNRPPQRPEHQEINQPQPAQESYAESINQPVNDAPPRNRPSDQPLQQPQINMDAGGAQVQQPGPAPVKKNIFDQRDYVAPGTVQNPEGNENSPVNSGLQENYPDTGSGNLARQPAQQSEQKPAPDGKMSGEATVEDILASVREIIGVENSEQEPVQPLGEQLKSEKDDALKKSLDETGQLKNEAFGQLKDVAVSTAKDEAISALDEVYPSEEDEEIPSLEDNIDLDYPQVKPDVSGAASGSGKGLQDRLKEKSPFQSAEELAKNWPDAGRDKAKNEQNREEPLVHENPFQPRKPDVKPDMPPQSQGQSHGRPQTAQPGQPGGRQMPPPDQAGERKNSQLPPQAPAHSSTQGQSQPHPQNRAAGQSQAQSQPNSADDAKSAASAQKRQPPQQNQNPAQSGQQQPGKQQVPPPGQQPPPHRNMPPPPPGQRPGGNMPGQPPQQRGQGPQGPGGPMPVPPPPGAPGQREGQRGAPPPHLAGHPHPNQPPQQGGRPAGSDPRMDGRPPVKGPDGQQQGQPNPRNMGTKGQLIENIPRIMRMGIPVQVEVRMARADVQEIERGMMGNNPPARHDVIVTEAMSVRLTAPDGGFNIALASPETQWIDNRLGGDNFASWKWTVTPLKSGKKALQLGISARLMGEKGVIAQSALPEQFVTVKVRVNYARTFKLVAGWLIIAVAGGAVGKYSERILELLELVP